MPFRQMLRVLLVGAFAFLMFAGLLAGGVRLRDNRQAQERASLSGLAVPTEVVRVETQLRRDVFGLAVDPLPADTQPTVSHRRAIEVGMPHSPLGPTSVTASLGAIDGDPVWVVEYVGVCSPIYGPVTVSHDDGCAEGTMDVVIDALNEEILEVFTTSDVLV